jgi:CRISPR-associated protein Cmr3
MTMGKQMALTLALTPLDVLFFRDGRPMEGGYRATSGLPMPQTVAGAVRTFALERAGCDFDALAASVKRGSDFATALGEQGLADWADVRVRGPWLAEGGKVLVPMPASLHREDKKRDDTPFIRLDPLSANLPGAVGGLAPLWPRSRKRTDRAHGWLTPEGLARFLSGGVPAPDEARNRRDLFEEDPRTGIGMNEAAGTTEEGLIYLADYLAFRPGVELIVEVDGPRELGSMFAQRSWTLPLGGQGRRVVAAPRPAVPWPKSPSPQRDGGRLLLLTTPAPFRSGALPEGIPLVAASVPGQVAFSGWDLARNGPKPTRFAAAAGSVLFLSPGAQPPEGPSLCAADDAAVGWGCFLHGAWQHV